MKSNPSFPLAFALALVLTCSLHAQVPCDPISSTTFSAHFPTDLLQHYGAKSVESSDSNFAVLGVRKNAANGPNQNNLTFTKLDADGNLIGSPQLINLSIGGTSVFVDNKFQNIHFIQTTNPNGVANGYALAATHLPGGSAQNTLLARLDLNGNVVWSRTFNGLSSTNQPIGLFQEPNGNLLAFVNDLNGNHKYMALLVVSSNGNNCQRFNYGFDPNQLNFQPTTATRVSGLPNNASFAVAGKMFSDDTGIMLLDNSYNIVLNFVTYYDLNGSASGNEELHSLAQDGNYIVGTGKATQGALLSKFDLFPSGGGYGGLAWSKLYWLGGNGTVGNINWSNSVMVMPSQQYVLGGFVYNTSLPLDYRAFQMKTDDNGTVQWLRHYLNGNPSAFVNSIKTNTGGILSVGERFQDTTFNDFKLYTVKTDKDGLLEDCDCYITVADSTLLPMASHVENNFMERIDGNCTPNTISGNNLALQLPQTYCDQSAHVDTCTVTIDITQLNNCTAQVCATVTGPGPYTYQWCDGSTAACQSTTLSCSPVNYCVTATCANGNTATASGIASASDGIAPIANCQPNVSVILDNNCNATITPADVDAGSFDNCQIVSMSLSQGNFTACGNYGVSLTVTDCGGNSSVCFTIVHVTDDFTLVCPADIIVPGILGPNGICVGDVVLPLPTGTGNCSPLTFSASPAGPYPVGSTGITWTATDGCGNAEVCLMKVTVTPCDTVPQNPDFPGFSCGQAVVTCYSNSNPGGDVMGIVDVRNYQSATPLVHWPAPMIHHPDWKAARMGEVFGIAIDKDNNIYVTATNVYQNLSSFYPSGSAGKAGVYKISALDGSVSDFVTTENNIFLNPVGTKKMLNSFTGPGLGNICYDVAHLQFFVSNFEDGNIYRIAAPGNTADPLGGEVLSRFDPFNPDALVAGPECLGERIWGVGVYGGRLYFGVWNNDMSNAGLVDNQIFSIALDATGNFTGSPLLEITLPTRIDPWYGAMTNPVTDIEFSNSGKMLIAERSEWSNGCDAGVTA
ncbi:MAG: hypothetical protein IT258_06575, partial [Saprospiraceae bacterium]|nr:hypothetical protein [Saprospiraceae bacterium]